MDGRADPVDLRCRADVSGTLRRLRAITDRAGDNPSDPESVAYRSSGQGRVAESLALMMILPTVRILAS